MKENYEKPTMQSIPTIVTVNNDCTTCMNESTPKTPYFGRETKPV